MILLVGYKGSIGTRYSSILNHLKVKWVGAEVNEIYPDYNDFKGVIIATPTDTHIGLIRDIGKTIPILCEKPISKNTSEIEGLIKEGYNNVKMVNNWAFALANETTKILVPKWNRIEYNNFRTGKDGLEWDCIQLIYLDPDCKITTDKPMFDCIINGLIVSYKNIEMSYVWMIKAWLNNEPYMWTLKDALEANKAVEQKLTEPKQCYDK